MICRFLIIKNKRGSFPASSFKCYHLLPSYKKGGNKEYYLQNINDEPQPLH